MIFKKFQSIKATDVDKLVPVKVNIVQITNLEER